MNNCRAGFPGRVLPAVLLWLIPFLLAAQTRPIRLRNELIQTPSAQRNAPSAAPAEPNASGLFLVQFEGPVQTAWRTQLEAAGVEFLRYVPDDAWVVRLNNTSPGQLRREPFVRWLGNYRAAHKLHRDLPLQATGNPVSVTVLLAPRTRPNELAAARALLNGSPRESRLRFGTVLRGEMDSAQINSLANSDAVLWIEPQARMKLFDEESSKIVGGDDGERTTPTVTQQLGYDGSGVVVAVADSGLDNGALEGMHPDLAGRVDAFFFYGALADASDEHGHGTHVSGIVAGNAAIGTTDELGALYGLGVAPGAHIVAQRMFDGFGGFEAPPTFETLTRDALSAGAVIGNNSWGEDTQGRYDVTAAEFDELVRDADFLASGDQPYILEFSAGNAGPAAQTIGTPAVAKNVIASGASQNNRPDLFIYAEGEDAMADFSSRGPCEDGRIKPDVVAPGTWIASLRSQVGDDNNAWAEIDSDYMFQGGTSQAGPHVAGAAAVFVQYYRELAGGTPSPALVKAALINSAVDLLDEVGTDPAPNHDEGWGRIDLTQIIGTNREVIFMEQTNLLETGASYETTVVLADTSAPLKITLVYTDVPGFPGAVPALVNDLDLEVTGPNGVLYRGNRFLNGNSVANSSAPDAINNVEGVHLLAPAPGEYRVRVHARNVPEDARIDSPEVDQDFALVISGAFLPLNQSLIFLDREVYRVPDRMFVEVIDRDRAGQPSLTVTISSDVEPGGETLTLFPRSSNGIFTNSIVTGTNAPSADGILQVAHNNVIEARYHDVSAATLRTDTATIDLLPPMITGVTVTNRFARPFISWSTDELANSRVDYGTNLALGLSVSNASFLVNHGMRLARLVPGLTYYFRVVSADKAGNITTNNNGGALFSFVAPNPPAVLLVNGFYDDLFFDPPPPLGRYTNSLGQLGVTFDVWEHAAEGSPTLEDLQPYRVVIWRVPELNFTTYTSLRPGEREAITNYLNEGGSLFISSMELLSRLGDVGAASFRADPLNVASFMEDTTVGSVTGTDGDPIGDGIAFDLDYFDYLNTDFSDTIVPSANAAGIFIDDLSGDFAGLRYPRTGLEAPGRLVLLSFPFEAVPETGLGPNNKLEVMRRILTFLAPGLNGEAVLTLDRAGYALPSTIIVEVGDVDLEGAGEITVTAFTDTEPLGQSFTLTETSQRGFFRGEIPLISAANAPAAGYLRGSEGDVIVVRFFDASEGQNVEDSAVVDVTPPVISNVESDEDYSTATIFWDTDERADALVQFGESLPLPINRTVFDPSLTFNHEVTLAGLRPDRQYYYRVVSRDAAGNTTVDDNGGAYYTFHTRKPLTPPIYETFETGATNWTVFSSLESETQWTLGVPNNSLQTEAHSPVNAWGSVLNGSPVSISDTFLISPAIHLTNGNNFLLRFWHSYDFSERSPFDVIEGGEVLLIESDGNQAVVLETFIDSEFNWIQEEIDLSAYAGKVVYLVWHHQLLSFDLLPRSGWLVDDVEIAAITIVPGTIVITNNLSQARFTLAGKTGRNGVGTSLIVSNAPAGQYVVTYGSVPYYFTPAAQTNTLSEGGTTQFNGVYTFADANGNGISDAWEEFFFGGLPPVHPPQTDSDGDGMSDYAEFIAGTNPTNSNARLTLTITRQPNNLLRVQWPTSAGRSYRLWSSTNLASWSPVNNWTRAAGSTSSLLFSPATTNASYRVQVRP